MHAALLVRHFDCCSTDHCVSAAVEQLQHTHGHKQSTTDTWKQSCHQHSSDCSINGINEERTRNTVGSSVGAAASKNATFATLHVHLREHQPPQTARAHTERKKLKSQQQQQAATSSNSNGKQRQAATAMTYGVTPCSQSATGDSNGSLARATMIEGSVPFRMAHAG